MDREEIRARASQIQWFHKYELVPGVMTEGPGLIAEQEREAYFQIPQDLQGKRVLDVGCADGYFTFLAESRGASVVAIDAWPHQGFFLAHEVRGSKAEFYQMDLYDLQPDTLGTFDIVFFMGVYYMLAKKQKSFNQGITSVLTGLMETLERTEPDIEDLQAEVATLRAEVQTLQTKVDKQVAGEHNT